MQVNCADRKWKWSFALIPILVGGACHWLEWYEWRTTGGGSSLFYEVEYRFSGGGTYVADVRNSYDC